MNIALWEAAQSNDVERCKDLMDLEKHKELVAQPNSKGLSNWTALHIAAAQGSVSVCELLLDPIYGTDINARTSLGRTALHQAILKGHLEVAQVLVEHGADMNAVDTDGNTCLHLTCLANSLPVAAWLLALQPNPNIINNLGKRAIDVAGSIEMQEIIEEYVRTHNLVLKRQSYGRTPFEGVLRHNSRQDYISKILSKAREQVSTKALKNFYKKVRDTRGNKCKTSRNSPIHSRTASHYSDEEQEDLKSLEDFIPLCLLGHGSFGEVYLVRKANTGRNFAIKVIHKDKELTEKLKRYCLTERRIMSYVKHPFIASLKAAFQTPENLLILMDYYPGGELTYYLNKEQRFSEEKARIYLSEMLLALEELHRNHIIYRDLKPSNILLDSDGHAILIDFGLAKEGIEEGVITKSFCGSPAYLPPEILKKAGHTLNADWYQLGVLLYEMLTGAPPYFSPIREVMLKNIDKAKLTFPKWVSEVSKDLISKLLTRDTASRLGSGKNGVEDIKNHPFFRGINWNDVLMRKLKPPLPRIYRPRTQTFTREKIYGNMAKSGQMLEDWSFLSTPQ